MEEEEEGRHLGPAGHVVDAGDAGDDVAATTVRKVEEEEEEGMGKKREKETNKNANRNTNKNKKTVEGRM